MDLVVTVQVEENYGEVDGRAHWKPKGGVQWVFPIKPQTMFWMWDNDLLQKKYLATMNQICGTKLLLIIN